MTSLPRGSITLTATARVRARGKRQGDGAGKCGEALLVDDALQRLCELLPGVPIGEKGLRDAEGAPVIVAVDEPGGDLVGAGRA